MNATDFCVCLFQHPLTGAQPGWNRFSYAIHSDDGNNLVLSFSSSLSSLYKFYHLFFTDCRASALQVICFMELVHHQLVLVQLLSLEIQLA